MQHLNRLGKRSKINEFWVETWMRMVKDCGYVVWRWTPSLSHQTEKKSIKTHIQSHKKNPEEADKQLQGIKNRARQMNYSENLIIANLGDKKKYKQQQQKTKKQTNKKQNKQNNQKTNKQVAVVTDISTIIINIRSVCLEYLLHLYSYCLSQCTNYYN